MSLRFTLRAADLGDAEGVARLCERADRAPWPASVLAPHPDRCCLVAIEGDGALIGVAKTHLHVDDDPPAPAGHYLGGIVVDPAWRRRGVGTALTLARLDWVSQRAAAVYYFTNVRNAASLALRARLDFEQVARAHTIRGVSADEPEGELVLHRLDTGLEAPLSVEA